MEYILERLVEVRRIRPYVDWKWAAVSNLRIHLLHVQREGSLADRISQPERHQLIGPRGRIAAQTGVF